jgi:hypothetical protein
MLNIALSKTLAVRRLNVQLDFQELHAIDGLLEVRFFQGILCIVTD